MKKQLLTALLALSTGVLTAQTCNPQYQDSTFGAWPDTTTNFAPAFVNVPYVQLLDFKAPSDAGDIDPAYSGATINSYRVTSVNGLPSGFTYQCSAANCQYNGGTAGCAQLTGTANNTQIGTHPIDIVIQATIMIGSIPAPVNYTFSGYKLIIQEQELGTTLLAPDQVYIYPNPASTMINIVHADLYETIEIYGVNGQLISQKGIASSEEQINLSDVKEGVYFIHLIKGETKNIHKFVKK